MFSNGHTLVAYLYRNFLYTAYFARGYIFSKRKKSYKSFYGFYVSGLSAWQTNIYIADTKNVDLLSANNLVFLWPALAIYATAWLIHLLSIRPGAKGNFTHSKYIALTTTLFVLQSALTLSGNIFDDVYYSDEGALILSRSDYYFVYILAIAASIIATTYKLYSVYSNFVVKSPQRKAIRAMSYTILLTMLFAVITNLVIPLITGSQSLIGLGLFTSVIFAAGLAISISRYSFLDIKLVVARSVAYVSSVGLLVMAYAAISTLLARKAFYNSSVDVPAMLADVILFVIAMLIYPELKRFFDRVTNKLFYRDAYDPQTFLDQLNKTLVGNIEIGILLRHTAAVIEENIKAECRIYIKETDATPARVMGTIKRPLDPDAFESIKKELAVADTKTVVTDELQGGYSRLKAALEGDDIAIISSLVTNYAENQEATAYLILGPKKSGNAYNKQDIRIINIITDELLIAIQNALRFEEIQSFNITLQNRINDATAKLKRSNEKLKELDETKDEFISMASHQLRTPLTSVKGYLSMVLDGDAGKVTETQQQLLNQAYVSSQRMVYLIADLLNVSRLKTGKFIIDAKPTNLADMVESEIAQLIEVAKGRKVKLTYDKPKDFPELMLDETKTRQVVMNFVDNAIYYTPSGGKIKIELRADRSSVYFMVKDNGLGVPKSEQPHMFTKFYRAKNAQKARPDGTGLGLFMAKKVINDQGGAILFESIEGKGSTFGFKFDLPRDKRR